MKETEWIKTYIDYLTQICRFAQRTIEFHQRMGFTMEPGDLSEDSIPITLHYLRQNDRKVVFKKVLTER